MADSLRDFLPRLQRQLGLYVPGSTFLATCAFILGYGWGRDDGSLDGFHDWLLARGNGRSELGWPSLVLCEIYPHDRLPDVRKFTEAQDKEAIQVLFELLAAYLGWEARP